MSSNQSNEQQIRQDIQALLAFINRLGNASRGIDNDLDARLTKIKHLSEDSGELNQLLPVLEDTAQRLRQHSTVLEQEITSARTHSLQALNRLISQTHLSPAQRQTLRELLGQFEGPLFSFRQLLPLLSKALNLCVECVPDTNTAPLNGEQLQSLQGALTNLLSTIDFSGAASQQLQNLRQRVLQQVSAPQLLELCIESLQLVIKGTNQERQEATAFLLSLQDALQSVNHALHKALTDHDQDSQQQALHNESVTGALQRMTEQVQTATSLQQLKQDIGQQITDLTDAFNHKLSLERDARAQMHNQLLSMQARLEDVESEAAIYKRKLNEQKFKSLQDSLTRLPNRAAFEERLQLEYQRWQSYAAPLAIAIADIDHFKNINDSYGHSAGDKTLQVIANMLQKSMRDTDFVCRYGGEEFVILFPQTQTEVAFELLEKARHRIKSIPFKFKQQSISITVSAGLSFFQPGDTPLSVFERADRALYEAKDQGRDRVYKQ